MDILARKANPWHRDYREITSDTSSKRERYCEVHGWIEQSTEYEDEDWFRDHFSCEKILKIGEFVEYRGFTITRTIATKEPIPKMFEYSSGHYTGAECTLDMAKTAVDKLLKVQT